jgi:hypothetical protein
MHAQVEKARTIPEQLLHGCQVPYARLSKPYYRVQPLSDSRHLP